MYGAATIDDFIPTIRPPRATTGIFFILGAGASVDSGLPTYRGPDGLYASSVAGATDPSEILSPEKPVEEVWEFLRPLYRDIATSSPGPTYRLLKELVEAHPDSFILTQNIDGHARACGAPVIELHGSARTMVCMQCKVKHEVNLENIACDCGGRCRPDIVLYGESVPAKKGHHVNFRIKTRPARIVIVGTSMQFSYLRDFVFKAKQRGGKVLHINPDPEYGEQVMKNERWLQMTAAEGLQSLLQT